MADLMVKYLDPHPFLKQVARFDETVLKMEATVNELEKQLKSYSSDVVDDVSIRVTENINKISRSVKAIKHLSEVELKILREAAQLQIKNES